MNSKKVGLFAVAALTVLATQASAKDKDAKKATAAAHGKEQCLNSCSGKGEPASANCAGHAVLKAEGNPADKAACETAGGKWGVMATAKK